MFDDYNSPNGFKVHRENVNESETENEINVHGSTMFKNKNDYYPDYDEYNQQGNVTPELIKAQEKLKEEKRTADSFGTVINTTEDTIDPNSFFNNTSQVYLLYNLGEKFK